MGYKDKAAEFCDNIPAADVSDWVDLGPISDERNDADYGPGKFIVIEVRGQNLALDADPDANPPKIQVRGRYDENPAGLEMEIYVGLNALHEGGVKFCLPSTVAPSVRLNLANLYTGRWSAWVVTHD